MSCETSPFSSVRVNQPFSAPPALASLATVRSELKILISQKDTRVLRYNVHPKDLEQIVSEAIEAHRAIRISFEDFFNLIIKFMPGNAHESASMAFYYAIRQELKQSAPTLNLNKHLVFSGAALVEIGHPEKKFKMADCSFTVIEAGAPGVVVEVGCSENKTETELEGDAKRWLSHDEVHLVILVDVSPPSTEAGARPKIFVEEWIKIPDTTVKVAESKKIIKLRRDDWSDQAQSMTIPLDAFFPACVPGEYGNRQVITLDNNSVADIRESIITAWEYDVKKMG
ncbi:hypothetical protein C8J56DRAFT_1043761 [Mycena floridula]|nr:hypothetical protein C8J56DRAFT_1043761 [Mycena floridula]